MASNKKINSTETFPFVAVKVLDVRQKRFGAKIITITTPTKQYRLQSIPKVVDMNLEPVLGYMQQQAAAAPEAKDSTGSPMAGAPSQTA